MVGIVYDVHCVRKKKSPHVTDGPSATRKLQTDIWQPRACLVCSKQNLICSVSDARSGMWTLDESPMMSRAAEAAETVSEDTMFYNTLNCVLSPDQ